MGQQAPVFLGTAAAKRKDYQLALVAGCLLLIAFACTAPWADRPLQPMPAFVPVYNAAVIVLDLITALLLFAQYQQLRELSFLVLTCGYLFTPLVMTAHAISFPDAFVPGILLGGSQTTAWLWMGWHALFPLFVAGYAVTRYRETTGRTSKKLPGRYTTVIAVGSTIVLAAGIILLTTLGEHLLPPLMTGPRYRSTATWFFLMAGWAAHLLALVLLVGCTRLRRLIDCWLAVTILALLIDLALSALLINARYQVGFYFGRLYGLLAAIFVLVVLLRETVALYGNALRSAEQMRQAEERYRTALNAAEMAAWDWNTTTDAMLWNDQQHNLLGLAPDQELKTASMFLQFVHPDDRAMVAQQLQQAAEKTGVYRSEFRIIRTDGRLRWINGYGRTVAAHNNRATHIVGVMYDITGRKQAEQQKEEFIGIASHELKTPVTSIGLYAEMLLDELEEAGYRQGAALTKKLTAQVDRLAKLIRDLLDTSRITAEELPLFPEAFDLGELVQERLEELRPVSGEHPLKIYSAAKTIITADRERIGQVVTNLVTNAIKYSPQGGEIIIRIETMDDKVQVSVQDHGIGIPAEVKDKIFDRFFRVSNATLQTFPGMGLGLYISAGIIHRHGGVITVESREGEGAVFTFVLPLEGSRRSEAGSRK